MSQVLPINPNRAVYNGVKIKINDPQATIPTGINSNDNGEYNSVNIVVGESELSKKIANLYSYPEYNNMVTYDMTGYAPVNVPQLPVETVAYKSDNEVRVPEPYLTNIKEEKNLAFHGTKANKPEIYPSTGMKPSIDMNKVVTALESDDYDKQAKQMAEIVSVALKDKSTASLYITTPIISSLINILEKDTSSLQGPDEAQTEIRKKIIINEILKEQQRNENKKPEEMKLPYELTDEDYKIAMKLNPLEMAERNKEYAMYTIASLAKIYSEDYEKMAGSVAPLTDLPGVSNIVDVLKNNENPSLKATALETLLYINRPEYKDEISAILKIASNDKNEVVAQTATMGLQFMEGKLK
mgnify:CR=1 FL=1